MREPERPAIALPLRTLFALAFLAVITGFALPLAKKALRTPVRALAEKFPFKRWFVELNGGAHRVVGRRFCNTVYRAPGGMLLSELKGKGRLEPIADSVAAFSKWLAGKKISFIYVQAPSKIDMEGTILPAPLVNRGNDRADDLMALLAEKGIHTVDFRAMLTATPEDLERFFYRTDHHWNADGAFAAYEAYMRAAGHEPLSKDAFSRREIAGYSGSTQSRSALWLHPKDALTIDAPNDCKVTVTFSDDHTVYHSLFFEAHLSEYDWYPVFLDGNHPITVIENERAEKDAPVLLLVKDSFGNSLAPLLVPSYRTIVMVDPRYSKQSISELAAEYGAEELLFCYSIERIATDLALKRIK